MVYRRVLLNAGMQYVNGCLFHNSLPCPRVPKLLFSRRIAIGRPSSNSCSSTAFNSASTSAVYINSEEMAVDITKHNLKEMLPTIQDALDRCTFFALDCEMTGLFTDGSKHEYLDDIQARYSKMADSSKAYIITQYGLSCFEMVGPSSYLARTFNFYVFPQPYANYNRRFLCDASSLAFLSAHGFDFNKCIGEGVPYMPIRARDMLLTQVARSYEPRSEPASAVTAEDREFLVYLRQLVTDWLAGSPPISDSACAVAAAAGGFTDDEAAQAGTSDDEDATASAARAAAMQQEQYDQLLLPPMNSFKRLLAYQELSKAQFGVEGHPGFWVKKLEDARYLLLIRASPQQAEQLEAEARAAKIAAIQEASGFAAVFDAMRRSHKPAVGHNCMFDVAYGLYSFADSYLPSSWWDYKKMVNSWHPGGLYDTKYLARRFPEVFEGNTSLSDIFGLLTDPGAEQLPAVQQLLAAASQAAGAPVQLPTICHAPGCDKYRNLQPGEAAHEAGYDAFMTGAAFARLLPLVQGKCAAEPSSELGTAYARQQQQKQQQQQQQQQPAAHDVTVPAATQVVVGPQSVQLQEPHQQQLHGISSNSQQQQQPAATGMQDPLAFVGGLRGRLNLTFTDIAYAALGEEVDPIPLRPGTFHIEGLNGNWRPDILRRKLQQAGLGQVRITLLDSSSCLAEFSPESGTVTPQQICNADPGFIVTPWQEYAQLRYLRRVPEPSTVDGNGAAVVAGRCEGDDSPSVEGKGIKRARADAQSADINDRHQAKSEQLDVTGLAGNEQPEASSRCSIM